MAIWVTLSSLHAINFWKHWAANGWRRDCKDKGGLRGSPFFLYFCGYMTNLCFYLPNIAG